MHESKTKLPVVGNRMSILGVSLYCSTAAALSEQFGAGRAAAMGKAFHAMCEGKSDALLQLTDPEAQQVMGWHRPADVVLDAGEVLRYKDADQELEVGLTRHCAPCGADDPELLTLGHLDFAWVVSIEGGRKRAYVVDIKKSEYTVTEGPESLQLRSYGLAYALKMECDEYVTAIWAATEGGYDWGEVVDVEGEVALKTWKQIKLAASNRGTEASTGEHCDRCYGRRHCPEYLLPGSELIADGVQLALLTPGGITADNAPELLTMYKSAKTLLDCVKKLLEGYAGEVGGIPCGEGKVWRKVVSKGGKWALDHKAAALEAVGKDPELEHRHSHKTKPRSMGFKVVNS